MVHGGGGPATGIPPGVRPLAEGDPVVIGGYPLLGRLGAGGMGVVYLAARPREGLVALKTPHSSHLHDATLRARFAEEVEFSRRVVPFCTASVIEDGVDGDRPYLVSEYIPGPALSEVMAESGPLPADLAYGVALGVAAALVAVHEAGLVHRDLKPGNVLLSNGGPRLIDFGIARDVDALAAHTQAGHVMGSPGWVAPERLAGGDALPASDVFSWGCLVAYAITGRHPFGEGDPDVLSRRILLESPVVTSVPAPLRPAVEAALARDPALRPRAAELLGALLATGGVGAPGDPRRAVAEVLARVWKPVPSPSGGGRMPPAASAAVPERAGTSAGLSGGARPRGRALLLRMRFAALAAVATVAGMVIAATHGGAGGSTGPGVLGRVPVVAPLRETIPGGASPEVLPPQDGRRPVPSAVAPSGAPPVARGGATRTAPASPMNGEREVSRSGRPRKPEGRAGEGGRKGCPDGAGERGKDCPAVPDAVTSSLPKVSQAGEEEGEDLSPAPSPAPAATVTVSPLQQGVRPFPQSGG